MGITVSFMMALKIPQGAKASHALSYTHVITLLGHEREPQVVQGNRSHRMKWQHKNNKPILTVMMMTRTNWKLRWSLKRNRPIFYRLDTEINTRCKPPEKWWNHQQTSYEDIYLQNGALPIPIKCWIHLKAKRKNTVQTTNQHHTKHAQCNDQIKGKQRRKPHLMQGRLSSKRLSTA